MLILATHDRYTFLKVNPLIIKKIQQAFQLFILYKEGVKTK